MDILLPDLVLESVLDIDLKTLKRRGIAGILID
ncbi:MAG TPA: YqeG family HAD IIIA-type phosphatase, partial [Firmicutes bacterium]|nr:YqeG family HAD IIIA-type phosphatase [Bacillota bacterium]